MPPSSSDRVQSVRNAWINRLRDEVLRTGRIEVAKVARVGVWIATYADADGSRAYPGGPTLATLAGCTEETVSRAVKVLIAMGLIVRRRRPNEKSAYQLLLPVGPLDWDAHLHLYTDTRQSRRKKAEKAKRVKELDEGGRNPSRNGVRNPFPAGGPDTVPAGGSETPGTRSGTVPKPVAERVSDPVPAGGDHYPPTCGRDPGTDHDLLDAGPQPQDAGARGSEEQISPEKEKPWGTCANGCGVRLLRTRSGLCHGCRKKAEGTQQDPQAPVQGAFLTPMPSGAPDGAAAPHTGTQPINIPTQDLGAPLRVCACGREHHARKVTDRCPDCLWAEAAAVGR
ncbi:helix-turn-helix domain-containing protein [Streptomyces sp. NPDC059605]|uniref:helix-turn-helix domain-containing protein n=1 Tax=Streptomyces sp. NPDC059605 TaxID=3346882 RepID=UPI0036BB427B